MEARPSPHFSRIFTHSISQRGGHRKREKKGALGHIGSSSPLSMSRSSWINIIKTEKEGWGSGHLASPKGNFSLFSSSSWLILLGKRRGEGEDMRQSGHILGLMHNVPFRWWWPRNIMLFSWRDPFSGSGGRRRIPFCDPPPYGWLGTWSWWWPC